MFKRVNKLISKQERDEELGLTREVKADLGLDTAFDASDSSDEDESTDDESSGSDGEDEDNDELNGVESEERFKKDIVKQKENGSAVAVPAQGTKRKRDQDRANDRESDSDSDSGSGSGSDGQEAEGEEEQEDPEDQEDEDPDPDQIPMTINQAISNPITFSQTQSKGGEPISLCVICPLRELKNEQMVKIHLESNVSQKMEVRS